MFDSRQQQRALWGEAGGRSCRRSHARFACRALPRRAVGSTNENGALSPRSYCDETSPVLEKIDLLGPRDVIRPGPPVLPTRLAEVIHGAEARERLEFADQV